MDTRQRAIGSRTVKYILAGESSRAARRHAERDVRAADDPAQLLTRRAKRRSSGELRQRAREIELRGQGLSWRQARYVARIERLKAAS